MSAVRKGFAPAKGISRLEPERPLLGTVLRWFSYILPIGNRRYRVTAPVHIGRAANPRG